MNISVVNPYSRWEIRQNRSWIKTLEYWECLKTLNSITIDVLGPSGWNELPVKLDDLPASPGTLRLYGKLFNHSDKKQKGQYLIILSCALLPLLSLTMFFFSFEREDDDDWE